MEWFEKIAWYAVLGFGITKSWEIIGVIKTKINDDE